MKLHVRIDGGAAQGQATDPGAAWCGLVWEHDGVCYPEADHRDFGPDVLGQWAVAMRDLLRGAERVELRYVEGGHALQVARVQGDACLALPVGVTPALAWPATAPELAGMVCAAATLLAERVAGADALARDAAQLRQALERARAPEAGR
jgi:hypothetical protein